MCVFQGQKCENCDKVFHYYCLAKYASMQKESKCPQCRHILDTSYTSFVAGVIFNSDLIHFNLVEILFQYHKYFRRIDHCFSNC